MITPNYVIELMFLNMYKHKQDSPIKSNKIIDNCITMVLVG